MLVLHLCWQGYDDCKVFQSHCSLYLFNWTLFHKFPQASLTSPKNIYITGKCDVKQQGEMMLITKKNLVPAETEKHQKRQLMNYQFHCIFQGNEFCPGWRKTNRECEQRASDRLWRTIEQQADSNRPI